MWIPLLQNKIESKEDDDSDLLFCLYLVDAVKRLDDDHAKSIEKMKIQTLLFEI